MSAARLQQLENFLSRIQSILEYEKSEEAQQDRYKNGVSYRDYMSLLKDIESCLPRENNE